MSVYEGDSIKDLTCHHGPIMDTAHLGANCDQDLLLSMQTHTGLSGMAIMRAGLHEGVLLWVGTFVCTTYLYNRLDSTLCLLVLMNAYRSTLLLRNHHSLLDTDQFPKQTRTHQWMPPYRCSESG